MLEGAQPAAYSRQDDGGDAHARQDAPQNLAVLRLLARGEGVQGLLVIQQDLLHGQPDAEDVLSVRARAGQKALCGLHGGA